MSHYINSWCAVHGDLEVDSDSVGCPDCHERWYQCFLAIRDHLGGKPELVKEFVAFARTVETVADECAHPASAGIGMRMDAIGIRDTARAILSRIENGNG